MKYCLLVFSALLVMASCGKVETPKSKSGILRDGKWKLGADIQKSYRKFDTDTFLTTELIELKNIEECKKDDYLVFREGNVGALNTGEGKCPQGEAQEIDMRYGFSNNDTRMYMYNISEMFMGNDNVEGELTNFSENKFTIRYMELHNTEAIPNIDTLYYTISFTRF